MSEEKTIAEIPMFLFTCADGSMFEIPSNTPGLTAAGFQVDDDTAVTYDYVCMDSSKMPVHFQQFYLAGSRNTMPELPPTELVAKPKHRAKKLLKQIRKIVHNVDGTPIDEMKAFQDVRILIDDYFV